MKVHKGLPEEGAREDGRAGGRPAATYGPQVAAQDFVLSIRVAESEGLRVVAFAELRQLLGWDLRPR